MDAITERILLRRREAAALSDALLAERLRVLASESNEYSFLERESALLEAARRLDEAGKDA